MPIVVSERESLCWTCCFRMDATLIASRSLGLLLYEVATPPRIELRLAALGQRASHSTKGPPVTDLLR